MGRPPREAVAVDLNDTNIDPADPKYRRMLDNLQGNVLKPHGRKESDHLVLRFTGDPAAGRAWIRGFARDEGTSARTQIEAATAFRGRGAAGGRVVDLYLAATRDA